MAVALVDTNVLFASASARDEYHEPAQEMVHGIDHGELPEARITNYVVAEALNLTRERLGPDASTGMLDRLIEGTHFEIVRVSQADFNASQEIFRRYHDLSFVDSIIAAYMQREDVEYLYSFDDDFDTMDEITRLDTAENPYR